LPPCKFCGGISRVNALLFDDPYWVSLRSDEQEGRWSKWQSENTGKKVVVIEIGAGLAISTIRRMSEQVLRKGDPDVKLIRINLRDFKSDNLNYTQKTEYYLGLPYGGLHALQKIDKYLKDLKD